MSLQIVYGTRTHDGLDRQLRTALEFLPIQGTLWFGYPIFPGETVLRADALLDSQHGVIGFFWPTADRPIPRDRKQWEHLREEFDEIHAAVSAKLTANPNLMRERKLAIPIHTVFFVQRVNRQEPPPELAAYVRVADEQDLKQVLSSLPEVKEESLLKELTATLERVRTIKPRKRRLNIQRQDSRGATLRDIEKEIANLDAHQKKGAVECPEGPQRIRGLAGSGKTIVLALKAAYLHAEHPDWSIAVTFYTRSLQQQFQDLIRRFYLEQAEDEPDWDKLKILHAWGSDRAPGFYSFMARYHGQAPLSLDEAKRLFGGDSFFGACDRLTAALRSADADHLTAPFDAVLIDEAQDLPPSFFELAWYGSKAPHRVVWAYDELQNLGKYAMASPERLFGQDTRGEPRVNLKNAAGNPEEDIVLPKCYRNTPWALTTAHALGLGIYRKQGLVQWLEQPHLWEAIGYQVVRGDLTKKRQRVTLSRRSDSTPEFFARLIGPDDAVECRTFPTDDDQFTAVIQAIRDNVERDELLPSDILVIVPDPFAYKSCGGRLQARLQAAGLDAHIAGVTSSADEFQQEGSITISGVHRAKGNEAAMVYVLDAQWASHEPELGRKRNTLFTAITRSRAWVRIWGVGPPMKELEEEISAVKRHQFQLELRVPDDLELAKLRRLHRDMSEEERRQARQREDLLDRLLGLGEEELERLRSSPKWEQILRKTELARG